jgi:hypothetical protein
VLTLIPRPGNWKAGGLSLMFPENWRYGLTGKYCASMVKCRPFILVNSAKPLPKGLIYELLPATVGTLPKPLQTRKFPAVLLRRLNGEVRSPLYRKIQTPTTPEGMIKDNSILEMLESSLSDGALYAFRDPDTEKATKSR